MNPATTARQTLDLLLPEWHTLLQGWAASGELVAAAREALQLSATPAALSKLVKQWAAGVFEALPPIVLLPASSMPGAAGAYAISTGTIYLNADWLVRASARQAMAVLTEELGHHLDARLNSADSPGDEGELFATLLLEPAALGGAQQEALRQQDDHASLPLAGAAASPLAVELAAGTRTYRVRSTPIPPASPGRSHQEWRNPSAFAALRSDGSVVTWGASWSGGDSRGVDFNGRANNLTVRQIFSSSGAFAALRSDGSVVTWGGDQPWEDSNLYGGDSSGVDFNGPRNNLTVRQIFSTGYAFAALRSDGSVVIWGYHSYGGDASSVDFNGPNNNLTVSKIFSNAFAFAALRSDGSVVSWGSIIEGGDSSGVDFNGPRNNLTVRRIFSTRSAFAALRSDGSVVTWGLSSSGGDSSGVDFDGPGNNLTVRQIFSNDFSFAALRSDGSVVSWGSPESGGNSGGVDFDGPSNNLTVRQIFSTGDAFAALRSDGSVVSWGNSDRGGNSGGVDFDGSANNLRVTQIFSTGYAFAALRSDGSVISWGGKVPWEASSYGGDSRGIDFNGPANNLSVRQIFSTSGAFAALRSDGSVVSWGKSDWGGNSSGVDFDGPRDNLIVSQIFSTRSAFAALRSDGSVVTWGARFEGGNSSGVDFDGPKNNLKVASFANPFTNDWLVVLPSITLTISQASVTEDGESNLIYTFRRTGATTSALSVDYTVAGTATVGTDYTGISTEATTKTVTLSAGSSTATVTVDPTSDIIIENNETVALTLAAATNYAIGTSGAVIGTIINDDTPIITLAVSPASGTEDGIANLSYSFSRSGPTTAALTVNYTVTGTATLGTDYTGISPVGTIKAIAFVAGSATATVTLDPIADRAIEADETVVLTLAPGSGYSTGTNTSVAGIIRNDDIQSSTSTTLTRDQSTLTLIGARRANAVGNDLDNIITGNTSNNLIVGGLGKDLLTGGGLDDTDTFAFYALNESLLSGFDVITDYTGRDRIAAFFSVENMALSVSTGNASSLTAEAIASVLTRSRFASDRAAAFTAAGHAGTFLAFNDSRPGFQAASDSIIFLEGFTFSSTNSIDLI